MRINPILKKELKVGSRTMRISWLLLGVNVLLAIIVMMWMNSLQDMYGAGSYDYQRLVTLFPVLAFAECVVLSLMIPIMTSTSISGERERKTLDIMLTTPMKEWHIIWGKLESALAIVMLFLIASLPVLAIPFIYGGISWKQLPLYVLLLLYLGIYIGSVGIFCSSVAKRSMASTIMTIGIGILILVASTVGFCAAIEMGEEFYKGEASEFCSVWLLLNPYMPVVNFLQYDFTGGYMQEAFPVIMKVKYMKGIFEHWTLACVGINMLVSVLFLKLAERRLKRKKC